MKKITTLTLLSFLTFMSFSQITKRNWLIGGSGAFSHDKTTFSTGESVSTQSILNPGLVILLLTVSLLVYLGIMVGSLLSQITLNLLTPITVLDLL